MDINALPLVLSGMKTLLETGEMLSSDLNKKSGGNL